VKLIINEYKYTENQIQQLKDLASYFNFEFDTPEIRKVAQQRLSELSNHFIKVNRDKKIDEIL
jgi:ribonucleotide reductase alpha subunit